MPSIKPMQFAVVSGLEGAVYYALVILLNYAIAAVGAFSAVPGQYIAQVPVAVGTGYLIAFIIVAALKNYAFIKIDFLRKLAN